MAMNIKNISLPAVKALILGNREKIVVDIGTRCIKYMELEKGQQNGAFDVKNYRIIPTPEECLLSSYTENPVINQTALKECLETLVNTSLLWNRNTVLLLYDSTVIINWLSISPGAGENLEALVYEKLATFLPSQVSDWYIDYQVLEEKKDTKTILSEAVLRQNLFEFGNIMQDVGLNLTNVDISSFNVINTFHDYLDEKENAKKNIAIVNMGHTNTTVMVFKEGVMKNLRNLGVGGRDFTQNIMEAKQLTFSEAEKYKHEELFFTSDPNEDQNKMENYNMIKPSFGKLIKGMYDSFDHYLAKFREFKIHEILICGGSANFKNIGLLINKHLNIPVRMGTELINMRYNGAEMMDSDKNLLASALGGLLRD